MGRRLQVRHIPYLVSVPRSGPSSFVFGHLLQNARRAIRAKPALARPHAQPHVAAQIVERERGIVADGVLQHGAGDEFALADQLALQAVLFHFVQAMAQPVMTLLDAGHARAGRGARLARAQLLAGFVQRLFRHQAERRPLAADDGQHPGHAVARLVIQERKSARGLAALSGVAFLIQRAHAGPRSQHARLADAGDQLVAFFQQQFHFPRLDGQVFRVGYALVGGADDGDGVNRHDNVAIAGRLAAVEDGIAHAMIHRQHRALARDDVDGDARRLGDETRPRAGGVDRHVRADFHILAARHVAHARADDAPVAVAAFNHEADDLVVIQNPRASDLRGLSGGMSRQKAIGGAIRHLEHAADARVEQRLAFARLHN